MKALIVIAAVVLAGCAEPAPTYWYKTGATQAEFDMAMARCRMGLAGLPSQKPIYPVRSAGDAMSQAGRDMEDIANGVQYSTDCLIADGWHRGARP